MLVAGLVGGGAIGYFRFDHSVGWALVLGLTFAAILTYGERRALREHRPFEGRRHRKLGVGAVARLLAPFLVLLIAFLVGIVTESIDAFIVVFAGGLALCVVLRFTIWR